MYTLRYPLYRSESIRRCFSSIGHSLRLAVVALALITPGVAPESAHAQVQTYTCPAPGFGPVVAPVIPLTLLQSLKTVPNPVIPTDAVTGAPLIRADLADYIANLPAAIRLGKALFWEMQAGSDNKTACATCHFQAGADVRTKNQLNPGSNGAWDTNNNNAAYAPNYPLGTAGDFPFTLLPAHDTDNITGSQGVRKSAFQGLSKSGAELTAPAADPVFNVNGVSVRQVTGKNAPSVINAVFNHRNFHNGRAQPDFNGANPWGTRDTSARVWVLDYRGNPVQVAITLKNASLAAQAVGPALNDVEMSAAGRTFPDLGKKLLLVKPLGLQKVSAGDSVLGGIADTSSATAKGLKVSYKTLIQQAFQPKWWNSNKSVSVNGKSYTMMQANFSLYWGLAIMFYEATLVSDNSPMDQYLATRVFDPVTGVLASHDPTPLGQVVTRLASEGILPSSVTDTQSILDALALFELPAAPPPSFPAPTGFGVGCIGCHLGAETTSASVRNLAGHGLEIGDAAFKGSGFDLRMERMFTKLNWTPPGPLTPVPLGSDAITFDPATYAVNVIDILDANGNSTPVSPPIGLPVATYDSGWYNLGVRRTSDDPGLDGTDPFGKPLSWTRFFQGLPDPSFIKVPGNGLGCEGAGNATFPNELLNASGFPLLSGPLTKTEAADVAGTFKVAALRNVELNGPYFHNGGKSTLMQVVEFYDQGGDFGSDTNPTKAPAVVPLQLTPEQAERLVAFLLALTDERVRWQQAPFDHPELVVPNGDNPPGTDDAITIPAVGAGGSSAPLQRFLNLNPFVP